MAQSVPKAHTLTFFTVKDQQRVQHGPVEYASKGECERKKREARAEHGEAFSCAFIDPVSAA